MMVYRDRDLYLLPWVFDRLKAHTKVSKQWKKTLFAMEKMLEQRDNKACLKFAFKEWHKTVGQKRISLYAMPFEEL